MSDAVAAPATTAPTAEATTSEAPKEGGVVASPPPRTPDDDLDDIFKKAGGFKYPSKGKEKVATTASEIRRLLSRDATRDSAFEETSKKVQEYEEWKQRRQGISDLPARERMKAIDELLGEGASKSAREAYEEQILEEAEREKQLGRLSPQERHLQAELEKRDNELKGFKATQAKEAQAREHEQMVAQVGQIEEHLGRLIVPALTKAKISPDALATFYEKVADRIHRNSKTGLPVDEAEVAEIIVAEHDNVGTEWLTNKPIPDIYDIFESKGMLQPLKDEMVRRIKAKQNGGGVAGYNQNTTQTTQNGSSNGTHAPRGLAFWQR